MQCQNCNKETATIHLTEIVNGQRSEKHLCQNCAEAEGVTVKSQLSLNELLSSLLAAQAKPGGEDGESIVCPHCGISLEQFRSGGRLGCPHDYEVFKQALRPVIAAAHNEAQTHCGKTPAGITESVDNALKIEQLKKQLEAAVRKEDYETAAKLRDQIASLQ